MLISFGASSRNRENIPSIREASANSRDARLAYLSCDPLAKFRLGQRKFKISDDICDKITSTPRLQVQLHFNYPQNLITQSPKWRTTRVNSLTCMCYIGVFKRKKCPANPLFLTATSHASAAPPTASSRPRTTHPSKSPSARSTRTADTPARTRYTPSAASYEQWARAMIP
jgi:hypothetical protein